MSWSVENSSLIARSSVVAGNLPDWSIRTARTSFLVTFSSIQEPRSGMIQHECSFLSDECDLDGEVHARRAVQLGDDHALGAVDDELAAADHDRDLAEVDLLLDGLSFCSRTRILKGRP